LAGTSREFTRAIVRRPGANLAAGLTSSRLGPPDLETALLQHDAYVKALETAEVQVTALAADERFPDATFIEDTAVLVPEAAVIARPGAASRLGEEETIADALLPRYGLLERIHSPGTLEGGDVLQVGRHFYIGLSQRTNREGAGQLGRILSGFGYTFSLVPLRRVLHLKTGVAYLGESHLLAAGEFLEEPLFSGLSILPVPPEESYAANSVRINGFVLVPKGYDQTRARIERAGFRVIEVDVSEFRKLDGGLSCLSLRF